jgi:hypothetical protein
MTARVDIQVREGAANPTASHDDVFRIFSEDLNGLYQLSLLLTGNLERAARCLVAGLDCATEHSSFGKWARSWSKRMIVENAIRELNPRPLHARSPASVSVFPYIGWLSSGPSGHFELEAILALEDFERFVFVMSVLEHHSEHDCAILLECSVSEIQEARTSALEKLIDSLHMVVPHKQGRTQETN